MSREEAFSAFDALLDLGVTTFDCADIYTGVEELLGAWITRVSGARGRESAKKIRVHTKLVPDRDGLAATSRESVRTIVDRSRRRLGLDRVHLVQYAWWDYGVPGYVETGLWLKELVADGRVAAIGVTNFDTDRLREITDAGVPVASQQLQYSVLDHRPAATMADFCRERGIAMLCYGTLAGGLLTDRWIGAPDPAPPGPGRSLSLENRSLTKYRLIVDEFGGWGAFQNVLRALREVADRHDSTIAAVSIRYALTRPGVTSAIVGVSTPARMAGAVAATRIELDEHDLAEIGACVGSAPGPGGPVFGLERDTGSDHARIMKYNLNAT